MNILGLSCFYHDAAAALVQDGILVAAAEEERFNRKKHYSDFPELAINFCLEKGGITLDDIDYVVFYEKPMVKFERILTSYITTWPKSYTAFKTAVPLWLKTRLYVRDVLKEHFGDKPEILFSEHHISHAASAFLVSPFEEAAILTIDGVGEWTTTARGYGKGNQFTVEDEIKFPHSIGLFFSALTAYLGFRVNDAEWKVMGLAPYGEPIYLDRFEKVMRLLDDGSFRLDMKYFSHHHSSKQMFTAEYEKLLGQKARLKESELTEFHRNVASSGQKMVEKTLLHLANGLYKKHPCPNLCIGGGVGLNSVANWKILKNTPFENIFIQPAAGDDGAAVGAAFHLYNNVLNNPRKYTMDSMYLGPEYSDDEIEKVLKKQNVKYTKASNREDLLKKAAVIIADGNVTGWFQGRMEFGPRALGSRSILANPTRPDMKDIINAKIKYREKFRPFAPSVLLEKAPEWFDLDCESPYMLLVPDVLPEKRDVIPAVTHHDGTGRVQTVRKDVSPLYYDLISEVGNITKVPVVLNTSFNIRGEPIVMTPFDAYNCFAKTGMDYLVIGSFIVSKEENPSEMEVYAQD